MGAALMGCGLLDGARGPAERDCHFHGEERWSSADREDADWTYACSSSSTELPPLERSEFPLSLSLSLSPGPFPHHRRPDLSGQRQLEPPEAGINCTQPSGFRATLVNSYLFDAEQCGQAVCYSYCESSSRVDGAARSGTLTRGAWEEQLPFIVRILHSLTSIAGIVCRALVLPRLYT